VRFSCRTVGEGIGLEKARVNRIDKTSGKVKDHIAKERDVKRVEGWW
jgi:hypothetical protein